MTIKKKVSLTVSVGKVTVEDIRDGVQMVATDDFLDLEVSRRMASDIQRTLTEYFKENPLRDDEDYSAAEKDGGY